MPARSFAAHYVIVAACLTLLSACVLRPAWQKLAIEGQLQSSWLDSGRFRHRVLANGMRGERLVIYIEGDGGPWIRENRVSVDPTPVNPVLLRLMLGSTTPAVYLGRPCYFGSATDKGCGPDLWTFDRYGKVVVDSMCAAANRLARDYAADSVQLIGYSGGGAVVLGMSTCTERLDSLTTIAGNLDPWAWARYHGFTPLDDLSPIDAAMQASNVVKETHWQCRDDVNVPPSITDGYFALRGNAVRHIVESCSHAEGWEQYWPRIVGAGNAH